MKKIIDLIVFLGIVYSVGTLIGLVFLLLKITGRIKIFHPERFPRQESPFLMVSNHPSLIDPLVTLCLFFPGFLFHPLRLTPFSTPDKRKYYDPWYFLWIRPFSIPINRNASSREKIRPLLQMKRFLEKGKRIILFPEGGRTFKGKKFLYSKKRKRIREMIKGVGWLAIKTKVLVLLAWLEGTDEFLPNTKTKFPFLKFWKKIVVKIGKPLRCDGNYTREKATEKIEEVLLSLADEEG